MNDTKKFAENLLAILEADGVDYSARAIKKAIAETWDNGEDEHKPDYEAQANFLRTNLKDLAYALYPDIPKDQVDKIPIEMLLVRADDLNHMKVSNLDRLSAELIEADKQHKLNFQNLLKAASVDASNARQNYDKLSNELADTKSKLDAMTTARDDLHNMSNNHIRVINGLATACDNLRRDVIRVNNDLVIMTMRRDDIHKIVNTCDNIHELKVQLRKAGLAQK